MSVTLLGYTVFPTFQGLFYIIICLVFTGFCLVLFNVIVAIWRDESSIISKILITSLLTAFILGIPSSIILQEATLDPIIFNLVHGIQTIAFALLAIAIVLLILTNLGDFL
ncbi:MAG: hypothetical protein INQ03_05225 [Candidatus Heimdallarchaeota archaeon]|nr:hypothetical protein [Candidatus Heimdallarchaeota archaeon]